MNATDRSKLLDAMAGVKVLVTPGTLDAWDAYRELFDTDPMPSLVSEHYSARALQAWNKAPGSEASCGRCGTRLRGFTPSDALLCPFCVPLGPDRNADPHRAEQSLVHLHDHPSHLADQGVTMATKTKTKKPEATKTKTKKPEATKTKTKKPEAPSKGPTKLSVAQRIAQLTPEMFEDGNTPEALAKRSTVAELEKMLREAETLFEAREKAALNRAMAALNRAMPDPEQELGPIGEGRPTLGENTQDPAWPSNIVKGARVLVVESEDGDPAFEGVVDEEDRGGFLVSVKDKDGAVWWVDPRDCCVVVTTQEIQPATGLPHLVDVDPKTGDDIEPPAVDVAGDPLMAALGVTPETVDSFADLIDPAYEKRLDEAARAENVRRRAQDASNTAKEQPKQKRPLPPVGTKLTHSLSNGAAERAGTTTQTAEVVADGILFEGRTYPSLTAAGSAASVRAGLSSNVNGWVYWGLDAGTSAAKVSSDTIKAERDALLASLEGLAPVIIAILATREDTPIGVTNINKMLQAWTQKHDTVWRPFAGSAVASTAPTVTPPA